MYRFPKDLEKGLLILFLLYFLKFYNFIILPLLNTLKIQFLIDYKYIYISVDFMFISRILYFLI